jgi:MoaA/NifB/PqqE/SkfB family radical SAM enzyme
MKPCRRVGLDVGWLCGVRCLHCFYRFGGNEHGDLSTPYDVPLENLLAKVDKGRSRGCDHVVLEGWGEPTLYRRLGDLLTACRDRGMTTSIITNGVQPIRLYEKIYREWGLDHLHISSHGFGKMLDDIFQRPGSGEKQLRLKEWLRDQGLPFRTNITLQAANYTEIPEIIQQDADLGSFHLVMLGFLPHYEWADPNKTKEVAVAPSILRPYIERAAAYLKDHDKLFTIRYHPFCHLSPEWWPYVVNSRYVLQDPFEWNYELQSDDIPALWEASKRLGDSVAVKGEPCSSCLAYNHCGGINRRIVNSTGDVITAIKEVPPQYANVWNQNGGLHDLNPVNHLDGITPPFIRDSRRELAII